MATIPVDRNLISPMGDFALAVTLGALPGYRNHSVWYENPSVSNVQEEMTLVSGKRVLPTSGGEITVVSSDIADDGDPVGTGARTLSINYLDSEFQRQTYTVTLNGTTPVVSSGLDAYRFETAVVTSAGSNNAPVGNITISMGGNAQAIIAASQNESRETGFTVPAGEAFLSSSAVIATGRAGAVDVDFAFEYRLNGSNIWYTLRSLQIYQQTTVFDVIGIATLPAGTDFRVLAIASGSGPTAYVQVRGYMIDVQSQGNFA